MLVPELDEEEDLALQVSILTHTVHMLGLLAREGYTAS